MFTDDEVFTRCLHLPLSLIVSGAVTTTLPNLPILLACKSTTFCAKRSQRHKRATRQRVLRYNELRLNHTQRIKFYCKHIQHATKFTCCLLSMSVQQKSA